MKPVSYKCARRPGHPGYLTLPPGREAKNLACIVNPHGGPWARDAWGFNPEVQFLANRGYCVLQMNFRGSTGYGRKFWEASFGQWGLKMQDDVTDGVQLAGQPGHRRSEAHRHLRRQLRRLRDAGRRGVHARAVRRGVDYVGVSNLFTFMNDDPAVLGAVPPADVRDGRPPRDATRSGWRRPRRRCTPTGSGRRCSSRRARRIRA